MREVIVYTAARLLIFLVTASLLLLFGARGMLMLALAILVSGIVSYVLLSSRRDAMSSSVTALIGERRRGFERARAKEDPQPEPSGGEPPS